jgi:5-methyltetrahydrofolate--homocysteine methyltransferase
LQPVAERQACSRGCNACRRAGSSRPKRSDDMIIIGELINASRKAIGAAIEAQDKEAIQKVARDEHEAGADFIDVNAGIFVDNEPEHLKWLVKTVQEAVDGPCAIDSPNPKAIEAALAAHRGTPMINSISLEKERYENLMPIVAGTDMQIIALCMSDAGMPETVDDRMKIADKLVNGLLQNNVKMEQIYVDPLVQPMSVNNQFGMEFLDAVEQIMQRFEGIHTACGLSNISYGLPARKFLNQTFMIMAIAKGLDGAIVNPLDKKMMANIVAAETLTGKDSFCMNYLKAFRAGQFEM